MMLKTHMTQHTGVHPYQCSICSEAFIFVTSLRKHLELVHKMKQMVHFCSICEIMFSSSQKLEHHKKNEHAGTATVTPTSSNLPISIDASSQNNRSVCPTCGKSVVHYYLSYHMKCVHGQGKKVFKCDVCNDEFFILAKYRLHMARNHTGDKSFICELCGSAFYARKNLLQHKIVHKATLDYTCNLCKKSFTRKSVLKKHLVNLHPGGAESLSTDCTVCCRKFKSIAGRKNHLCRGQGLNRIYQCKCGKSFITEAELDQHRDRVHKPGSEGTSAKEEEDTTYPCSLCQRVFHSVSGRHSHELHIHGKYPSTTKPCNPYKPRQPKMNLPRQPNNCDICHATFMYYKSLKQHMVKVHEATLAFSCTVPGCSKSYSKREGLRQHVLYFHERDKTKRFKCLVCHKELSNFATLVSHSSIHSQEPHKYSCEKCGRNFRLPSLLKEHLVTHSDVMPEVCQICHKRFRRKSHLRIHIRTHTGEKPYLCEICGRAFAQSGDRNKHRNNMHKD